MHSFTKKIPRKIFLLKSIAYLAPVFFVVFFFSFFNLAFASETNGTIDSTYKYAWGENIGWINFGCDGCNVSVTDTGLTGNAWMSEYGWINLNPTTSGVINNAEGTLSGYAWSSNLGWINFSGVTINSSGEFSGYATLKSDNSRINFNCLTGNSCAAADFKVKTDWRPASLRTSSGGGGSSGSRPISPVPPAAPPIAPVSPVVPSIVKSILDSIFSFFNPKPPVAPLAVIPKISPLSMSGFWNLLPEKPIRSFVFAPLPYEIRSLAAKFPEIQNTLKNVGVQNLNSVEKLSGVSLKIPGLSDINTKIPTSLGAGEGKIALIQGLPIAKFSLAAKKSLPSEFVFVRSNTELIDFNVALSVSGRGEVNQQVSSLPGKTLKLVVKPVSKARSVTGYFAFKAATPKVAESVINKISRASLSASALFSMEGLVEKIPENIPVEQKLILSSFEYTDPDKDGIYTAEVVSPVVPGEYEVVTVIEYVDPELGTRRMRMITVIDPEGYVFEKQGGKETRIPSAIVSLYVLNAATKKYELWPAQNYLQENPQITDVRGTYSFLVPEGSYYFEVEAPGYETHKGKVFVVTEGDGIHQNIELKSNRNILYNLDWKTTLLIVVLLLLMYNLYRNSEQNALLKIINKNNGK